MASVLQLINTVIVLPCTAEELNEIQNGFRMSARRNVFRVAVGAIDGTHVRIIAPKANKEDYYCRKQFYSVQAQFLCDHRMRVLNMTCGYPGSVHDSRILRWSPLYRHQMYPPPGLAILGDGGYPCISNPITLITPFRQPVANEQQAAFNQALSSARSVVERLIGKIKCRWRYIYGRAIELCVTRAAKVIACCAILHNICLDADDVGRQN